MILELRPAKDDPYKQEIFADGERVENAVITKAFNDSGVRRAIAEITYDATTVKSSVRRQKKSSGNSSEDIENEKKGE